jgi:hypothetical protein
MSQSKMVRASKKTPCHVCGGDHKCSFAAGPDGTLILCGRKAGPQPGFVCLGPAKDPTWTMYKADRGERHRVSVPVKAAATDTGTLTPGRSPLLALVRRCARDFTAPRRDALARALGLPAAAADAVPDVGWSEELAAWTIPEIDADGQVVGVSTRRPDGSKRCVPGSRRGLVVSAGWVDADGPIFVVEGFSDVAALGCLGLAAVGRPSSHGGGDLLAAALRNAAPGRPIFVVGENDRKPDGRWPGKDGADLVAKVVACALPDRTVLGLCPPDGVKDVREWVRSRLGERHGVSVPVGAAGTDTGTPTPCRSPAAVGHDLAQTIAAAAKRVTAQPADLARRWPVPVPITTIAKEVEADPNPTGWLWDGYLPRGGVCVLSALPKCGKTTLLTHLLSALGAGGEFLGRAVLPGRAVVLTEEDKAVWAERQKRLNLGDQVALVIRPFLGRPTADDWAAFLAGLAADLEADGRDLVILDTLADLWPVRDENHATDVTDALKPLRRLAANGRTVLCIHHVRKSGGDHGTASRGSGAIAGFFDVMLELGYATGDPDGRRRKLVAKGRLDGIPPETLVEMSADGHGYRVVDERSVVAGRVKERERTEDERRAAVREALCVTIPFGTEADAVTRDEIWAKLPDEVRVNVKRFEAVLENGCGELWARRGNGGRSGYKYWRIPDRN